MTRREANWWYYCSPYGVWRCANGRHVLFNRGYQPIIAYDSKHGPHVPASCHLYRRDWEHWDGPNRDAPRDWEAEFVDWKRQSWFYNDGNSPWHKGRASAETRVRIMLVLADFLDGKMPEPTVLQ